MSKIVLCDIDGTIANNDHRQHLLKGFKDWDNFFLELVNDQPILSIIDCILEHHSHGQDICFITGRPERYRAETIKWLEKYFTFNFSLIMRKNGDERNKIETKKEMFLNFKEKDRVEEIYENDLELLELWKELSLKAINVNDFF